MTKLPDISEANLRRFAELAELGADADSIAHTLGISYAALDAACFAQWGENAKAVVARSKAGPPVRALSTLLDHARLDPKMALEVVKLAQASRAPTTEAGDERLTQMSREQLIDETEKALAHERALIAAKLTG